MDFLNKTFSQISDLFRSMTPGARITAGMLLAVIVVSLVYLFAYPFQGGNRYLYGGRELSKDEVGTILNAFGAAGLDRAEAAHDRVRVPTNQYGEYMKALESYGFKPQNFETPVDSALDSSNSLVDSKHLQDRKFSHADEKKLAGVISAMDGIEVATVRYRESIRGGFPRVIEGNATVAIMPRNRRPLDSETVHAVRTTASGWFGLDPADVTVTDLVSKRAWGGKSGSTDFGSAELAYADTKLMYEELWKAKIENCLSMIPGVNVGVNVELDPEMRNESTKVTVDAQPTAVQTNTYTKTTENRPAAVGGQPGTVPNGVTSNTPRQIQTASNQEATSDESRENLVSVPGHEQVVTKKAALVPKLVTATVSVPKSYYHKLWELDQPVTPGQPPAKPTVADLRPYEQEVSKMISDTVVKTLPPLDVGENPFPQVNVTSYQDLPDEPYEGPATSAVLWNWFAENWQTLAMVVVGVVCLLILRSTVRSSKPGDVEASLLQSSIESHEPKPDVEAEEPEQAAPALQRRSRSSGGSLRDELTAMVKEDPDAAANVLRTWIGDAA